jgi:hypothetical protein
VIFSVDIWAVRRRMVGALMNHRTPDRESKATPPALSVVPESFLCHAVDGVALGSRFPHFPAGCKARNFSARGAA